MSLGIRARFSLFILGSVMVILSSTMVSTLVVIRRFSIEDARDFSLTVLDETNTKITTFVTEMEYLARSLAEYRVVREVNTAEFRDLFLAQVLARSRYARAIYMGTTTGEMYEYGQGPGFFDHEPDLPPDYDPRLRPWYQAAIEADTFTVSDPYVYASYPLMGVTGAIPVRSMNDPEEIVGVIGIDILLDDLRNVLGDLQIPKDGKAVLLDDSGRIIASQFNEPAGEVLTLPDFEEPLFERIRESPRGSFTTDYRGQRTVMSHTVNPPTGWHLVLALPYPAIMEPANRALRFMAFLDLVLIVILLLTIRIISGRLVLRPIEQIVQVVNRIHEGDRNARIDLARNDEIGVLARELNHLVSEVHSYTEDMEQQVARRSAEVQELEQENSRLRLVRERERIYRDLHDSLGAQLTNISICATVARSVEMNDLERTRDMIERIDHNARLAIEGLRETILGEPDFSSLEGVIDRIEQMAHRRLSIQNLAVDFHAEAGSTIREDEEEDAPAPTSAIGEALYRVSEELISNIQKHSGATEVSISINRSPGGGIVLSCHDNGCGFETGTRGPHGPASHGLGLRNMRHRLETLGGSLTVQSDSRGTTVVCSVPLRSVI